MFCQSCGAQIDENWKVCPYCGSPNQRNQNYGMQGYMNGMSDQMRYQDRQRMQPEVLMQTRGGVRPGQTGNVQMFFAILLFVIATTVAIWQAFTDLSEEKATVILLWYAVVGVGVVIDVVLARQKQAVCKSISEGKLVITSAGIEGLGVEFQRNRNTSFIQPSLLRWQYSQIESASVTQYGGFLLVRAMGREYIIATPEPHRAADLIMEQVRNLQFQQMNGNFNNGYMNDPRMHQGQNGSWYR